MTEHIRKRAEASRSTIKKQLDKAAKRYADGWPGVLDQHWSNTESFKAGAMWMKRKLAREEARKLMGG